MHRTELSFTRSPATRPSLLKAGSLGVEVAEEARLRVGPTNRSAYDTKYAMHALRIGYQGIELLETGAISLPVPEPQRSRLMEVRMGDAPIEGILAELGDLIRALEGAPIRFSDPPADVMLEQWLVATYQDQWRKTWRPIGLE